MFFIRRLRAQRELSRNYPHLDTPEARGQRFLRHWLSTSQRKQFDTSEYFDVIGCDTGKTYRIHYGRNLNVHELDEEGHPKMGWCFVPKNFLVAGEVMLAQKIALETFEVDALEVALRFRPIAPTHGRIAWTISLAGAVVRAMFSQDRCHL
jgi:hypothetical protein